MRVLLLVVAIALTYANSVANPFVLDDQATVVQNPQIRDLSRVRDVLVPAPESPIAGRPLTSLTFALNYAVNGLDVRGYHLVNIALHLTCAVLLMLLVRRTLSLPRFAGRLGSRPADLAWAAAVLWGVHPLTSEVINYISQRSEALMAACFLLTLYAAARAYDARGLRWTVVAVVACAGGVAAKESMVVAPVMVALYDRVFLFASWHAAVQRRRWLYAGLAATWLFAGLLIASGPRAAVAGFSSGISPWTYLLNQAVMITGYLRLAVWPDALVVFYGWPEALGLADVAPYVALMVALLAATGIALWRQPAWGFLGAWFFLTLAPASSIVPIATEVGAERRMYLPLMALAVLALAGVDVLWSRTRLRRVLPVPVAAAVILATAAAAVTVARNREYASPLTLAQTVVDRRPTNVAHHILGEHLIVAGRRDEATPHLRIAVAGGDSRARYPLGRVLAEQGNYADAVDQLSAFIATATPPEPLVPRWLEPPITEVITARLILGRVLFAQQQPAAAGEQAAIILGAFPNHSGAYRLRADVLFAQQQWPAAADAYREYLRRAPADAPALINYGITQAAVGNLDGAIGAFTGAVAAEPANARAKQLLALAQDDRARLIAQP
jgi:tetratricopeptide (TPR) repeat protein